MTEYLLFHMDRTEFDGEDFEAHLNYLDRYGGTPDCWKTIERDTVIEACQYAEATGQPLAVVHGSTYEVIGTISCNE